MSENHIRLICFVYRYGLYSFKHALPLFIIVTTKRRQFGKIKLFISKTSEGNCEEEKKEEKKQRKLEKNKAEQEESLSQSDDEEKYF